MTEIKKRILFIGLIILCLACSTTQKIKIDKVKANFKPEIDLLVDSNNLILNFTLNIKSESAEDNKQIQLVKLLKVEIVDEKNLLIDSSSIESLITAGKPIKRYNVIYFGKIVIDNFNRNDFENLTAKFTLLCDNWDLTYSQKLNELLNSETEPALSIYPIIEKKDEKSIDLGVFAVRKRIIEEYIPNSENIRIEVLNSKNKPVYNSQEGKAFMQIIMPVEPQNLGDSYIYEYSWDYRDNKGKRVPTGEYTVRMMIPANPKPYITEIKIPVETK